MQRLPSCAQPPTQISVCPALPWSLRSPITSTASLSSASFSPEFSHPHQHLYLQEHTTTRSHILPESLLNTRYHQDNGCVDGSLFCYSRASRVSFGISQSGYWHPSVAKVWVCLVQSRQSENTVNHSLFGQHLLRLGYKSEGLSS